MSYNLLNDNASNSANASPWLNLKVNDINVTGEYKKDGAVLNLTPLAPGAANTFLHTNSLSNITWITMSPALIPAGLNDQILRVQAGVLAYADKIVNSNLPDNLSTLSLAATSGGINVTGVSSFNSQINCTSVVGSGQLRGDELTADTILDVLGDLRLSSASGNVGEIIIKTGANTQAWAPLPSSNPIMENRQNSSDKTITLGVPADAEFSTSNYSNGSLGYTYLAGSFTVAANSVYRVQVSCQVLTANSAMVALQSGGANVQVFTIGSLGGGSRPYSVSFDRVITIFAGQAIRLRLTPVTSDCTFLSNSTITLTKL